MPPLRAEHANEALRAGTIDGGICPFGVLLIVLIIVKGVSRNFLLPPSDGLVWSKRRFGCRKKPSPGKLNRNHRLTSLLHK